MAGTDRIDGSLAPDTVVKGWKDADGWYHGSIYYEMGAYVPNASINSGSVTIVDNADGTYRVTVEAQEMNGHAIRADFTDHAIRRVAERSDRRTASGEHSLNAPPIFFIRAIFLSRVLAIL